MSITQSQETFTDLSTQARMPRVNLLPPEIVEGRKLRRTKGALAGSLVLVVAALGGVYALQVNAKTAAQDELTQTQAQTSRLQAEQAKYAEVPKTIAAIDAAEVARENAMANDVEWFRTMTNFALTVPSKVWFDTVQLQVNDGPAGAQSATGTAPGVGLLTVTGKAMDHPDVATWLDVLARQPGMSDAYFSSSSKEEVGTKSIVSFSSTATITDEALSHRYDRKQG